MSLMSVDNNVPMCVYPLLPQIIIEDQYCIRYFVDKPLIGFDYNRLCDDEFCCEPQTVDDSRKYEIGECVYAIHFPSTFPAATIVLFCSEECLENWCETFSEHV